MTIRNKGRESLTLRNKHSYEDRTKSITSKRAQLGTEELEPMTWGQRFWGTVIFGFILVVTIEVIIRIVNVL